MLGSLVVVAAAGSVGCSGGMTSCSTELDVARHQVATCTAALILSARDTEAVTPSPEQVERYFDRLLRAIAAEPAIGGASPQRYRNVFAELAVHTSNPQLIVAGTAGTIVTGDAIFDAIVADLEPSAIYTWPDADPFDGLEWVGVTIDRMVNEELVASRLLPTGSRLVDPVVHLQSDMQWTWVGDDAQIDVTLAWGPDCIGGCSSFHRLRAIVPASGAAVVFDLGGDPVELDPHTRPL